MRRLAAQESKAFWLNTTISVLFVQKPIQLAQLFGLPVLVDTRSGEAGFRFDWSEDISLIG